MFCVYILHSEVYDKYYIGYTHDLEKRPIAHNHLKNKGYTKRNQPWVVVFHKTFENKKHAMEYEEYLKSLKSKKAIIDLLKTA